MLALAAANAVGVVLFGALYAVAGANLMSQTVFLACLLVLFVLVTTMWVRTEARHRRLEPLSRVGRAAGGLTLVFVAVPILVLMPLFWLDTQLPPEAGFQRLLAPIMMLTLLSLVLMALTNAIGSLVIVARAVVGGRFARRRALSACGFQLNYRRTEPSSGAMRRTREEGAMAKVGRFVVDPKAGAYCQLTLDSGEKLIVNHDKGGFKGGHLTIEKTKWWGSGERIFACDLDSGAGRTAMARLTQGTAEGSADATPLGAFVNYAKDCKSAEDVKAKCAALIAGH
jgi:hypothetical protein